MTVLCWHKFNFHLRSVLVAIDTVRGNGKYDTLHSCAREEWNVWLRIEMNTSFNRA